MSEPRRVGRAGEPAVRGVVLAHGDMAEGMVDAVRQIAGPGAEALEPLSNRGLSPDALGAEIESRMAAGPIILFVDLPAGSCGFLGRRLCHDHPDLVVITGVNLPLLLDFVLHRELPLDELVTRLLAKGRTSIGRVPEDGESHGDRAVQGR